MAKFLVHVTRTTIERTTIELDADDWEQAEDSAMKGIPDIHPDDWRVDIRYTTEAEEA